MAIGGPAGNAGAVELVFSPEFIADLARRYGDRPVWQRPGVYFVATNPERSEHREWIEAQVAALDANARRRVIPRLRGDDHFISTFHELSVIAVLREAGLDPRYEPNLPGTDLTPDILVESSQGRAVVEVWTRRVSDERRSEARGWRELRERIRPTPSSLGLRVEPVDGSVEIPPPAGSLAKELAEELRGWLLSTMTAVGSVLEHPPYRFIVVAAQLGLSTVLAPTRSGGWVTSDDVLNGVRDKVRRYATAARTNNMSVVVAVAAETVPIDSALLRSALAGRKTTSVTFNVFDSGVIADSSFVPRRDDTRPAFNPALSAVAWLAAPGPDPKLEVFPIAGAECPLGWPETDLMITARS